MYILLNMIVSQIIKISPSGLDKRCFLDITRPSTRTWVDTTAAATSSRWRSPLYTVDPSPSLLRSNKKNIMEKVKKKIS